MIPIKPVGYSMIVKPVVQEQVSEGGIVLATAEEMKRQQAGFPVYEVIAQGDGCYKSRDGVDFPEGKWCEVGDKVVMEGYAGQAIQPKEFFQFASGDALENLKDMQARNVKFHIVNDDSVRAKINV